MSTQNPTEEVAVSLELGSKRVFAAALDWPGWCRSGKDEERALDALAAAGPRYRAVAREAGLAFSADEDYLFLIAERLAGSGTTDFGAPDRAADRDLLPLTEAEAERVAALVSAAWVIFDRVVAHAPARLQKGPRGGGRDRDAVVAHVVAAEVIYARKLGLRLREPAAGDAAAIAAVRAAIADALRSARSGAPLVERGWPPRYAARRIAWHVLDHAWEIEDRSSGAPA